MQGTSLGYPGVPAILDIKVKSARSLLLEKYTSTTQPRTSQDSGSPYCSFPRAGTTSRPQLTHPLTNFNIHVWFLLNHYDGRIIMFSSSATSCVFIHSLVRILLSHLSITYSQIKSVLSFEARSCHVAHVGLKLMILLVQFPPVLGLTA